MNEAVIFACGFILGFASMAYISWRWLADLKAILLQIDKKYQTMVDIIAKWQAKL